MKRRLWGRKAKTRALLADGWQISHERAVRLRQYRQRYYRARLESDKKRKEARTKI